MVRTRWRDTSAIRTIAGLSIAVATLPIVAAMIRALVTDWLPMGDNAYFTVRSRDVGTAHHPLLGAWSSGSDQIAGDVNNLGPLQLDLLAPFTKIGPVAGTAVGVGVVHLAAVLGIAAVVWRVAGPVVVALAMAITAGVEWTLGSGLLVETRQHHFLVLPFLLFLVLVWAGATGAAWAFPWMVLVGSLALQTHLSYPILIVVLLLWAVVGFGLHQRTHRRHSRESAAQWWQRDTWRWGLITVGVGMVCWIQPLFDQFFRTGNMGNVLRASGDGVTPGIGMTTRIVATVAALPPWWARPGFKDFDPLSPPSVAATVAGVVTVVAILVLGAWLSLRARLKIALAAVGTSLIALAAAWLATKTIPSGFGGFAAGNYRWLWPISAFLLFTVVLVGVGVAARNAPAQWRRQLLAGTAMAALASAVVFAAASVPHAYHAGDPSNDGRRMTVAGRLLDQLDDLDVDGPVLVYRDDLFFGEPYSYPVLFKLQELGIEFTFDGRDIHRFGRSREERGAATHEMRFAWGDAAAEIPAGPERVAFVAGLDADESRELQDVTQRVLADLREGRVEIDLEDARAANDSEFGAVTAAMDGSEVEDPVYVGIDLFFLHDQGYLDHDPRFASIVERWIELGSHYLFETIAITLTPIDDAGPEDAGE